MSMSAFEIIALVVTSVGVISFAIIFTILYRSYAMATLNEFNNGNRDVELIDEAIYENQDGVKALKRTWNIIKKVFFYLVLAILVPVFVMAISSKFTSGIAMIGGKGIIVVASGSMSERHAANDYLITNNLTNQFDTYDVISLEKVNSGDLKLYDVIAFKNDKGTNIIHRIVGFTEDGRFITRGDSNNSDDEYKPSFEDVLGRYTGTRIPYLGTFVMFLQSYSGIVTIVAIIYCLLMIDRITNKLHNAQEDRLELLNNAIGFENDVELDDNDLLNEFTEKIYYKGFMYYFNESGFVNKEEISDEELKKLTDNAVIKEITDNNGVTTTKTTQIPASNGDDDQTNNDCNAAEDSDNNS